MASKGTDEFFMRCALELAARGEGKVSPNPLVGAVVVKGGRVIGEGFHGIFGGPHAEANALSGAEARGATLYVTLEPCSHEGNGKKTPPCVPLIIRKKVARVVVASKDKNPLVRGIEQLKAAGIEVKTGVLANEADRLNEAYFKFIATGKPFVVLKMAQAKNGKIGVRGKGNVRISGKEFDAEVQRMRNRYDAVLVGAGTILADNPRLTCRMKGGRNPARIIMDSTLRSLPNCKALHNAMHERVIVAASQKCGMKHEQALREMGVSVLICGKRQASLSALVHCLPSLGIYSLLIEGGAEVASSALREKLVDKIVVCISQKNIAGRGTISSPLTKRMLSKLRNLSETRLGEDTVIEGYVKP